MVRTHGVEHYDPDYCFGCKVLGVQFAPSCFPTTPGGRKAAGYKKEEARRGKDLEAFKRMRLAGEHPRSTKGAARVESEAESSFEIESGQMAHKMARGRDAGKSVSRRGAEWRRRATDAHEAIQRGEQVSAS